jgi:hypothetical protein
MCPLPRFLLRRNHDRANKARLAPIKERKNMTITSSNHSSHSRPVVARKSLSNTPTAHENETSGLTQEEIRRIVLDLLG